MSSSKFAPSVALAATLLLAAPACGQAPAEAPLGPTTAADWRQLPADNLLVIDTSKGRIVVEMRPDIAPEYVERIKTLARQGFYDGLQFFRVIDDFMVQTGDKENTGAGEAPLPPLKGAFEFRRGPEGYVSAGPVPGGEFGFIGSVPVVTQPDALAVMTTDGKVRAYGSFCSGVAGMARTADPDSASSQFFLMRHPTTSLDAKYTAWGRVVQGLDVVRAIATGQPPPNPDTMTRVRIASDLPAGERPNVQLLNPASQAFQDRVAAARAAKGQQFTVCDVDIVARAG